MLSNGLFLSSQILTSLFSKRRWTGSISRSNPRFPSAACANWPISRMSRTCTNVIFLGPPGTGKTHLSLALADRALTAGHSVLFTTLADLAQALESASHPGLLRQRLRRYIVPSLLVIDEVGYTKLSPEQARHFFELVTARVRAWVHHFDFQYQLCAMGESTGRRSTCDGAARQASPPCGDSAHSWPQLPHERASSGPLWPIRSSSDCERLSFHRRSLIGAGKSALRQFLSAQFGRRLLVGVLFTLFFGVRFTWAVSSKSAREYVGLDNKERHCGCVIIK
jgi:hypothetical protein